jgi:hypothetical protein
MDITKVTLRPVSMNKVCAIASIVIDDAFVIHDLRVVNGDKGVFVAMPSRKLPNGSFATSAIRSTPRRGSACRRPYSSSSRRTAASRRSLRSGRTQKSSYRRQGRGDLTGGAALTYTSVCSGA